MIKYFQSHIYCNSRYNKIRDKLFKLNNLSNKTHFIFKIKLFNQIFYIYLVAKQNDVVY